MHSIGELADHYGFDVIEDASHAIVDRIRAISLEVVLIKITVLVFTS